MRITRVSRERIDWHYWQIIVICGGAEFLSSGERLIRSIEIASPDTRVVVCITDHHPEATKALQALGDRILSIALYEAQLDSDIQHPLKARYKIARQLLEMTRLPSLMLRPDSFVISDLTLLPAEVQKCDFASILRFDNKIKAKRVTLNAMWLAANSKTYSLLEEVNLYIEKRPGESISRGDEGRAVYAGITRCRSFLKAGSLPAKYSDRKHKADSYIFSEVPVEIQDTATRALSDRNDRLINSSVEAVIFYPKQDLGTKSSLKNNEFKMRINRISRPGRLYWRHMSRLIWEMESKDKNARIISLPQWEIGQAELENYPNAEVIYVPHLIRRQLDHPKARYYMQELIPNLFTIDGNGWGASSSLCDSGRYATMPIDEKLDGFLDITKSNKSTKAPQSGGSADQLPEFDILAPLQVPGDDALIFHSTVSLEQFVRDLASFADRSKTRVLFRKHPYDSTDMFETMKEKFASDYAIFNSKGHIHDALLKAKAVAVINSGVGFEAMIYNRPVLSFGRAIYDEAVERVSGDNLDVAYANALREAPEIRWQRYRQFMSWYIYVAGYKVDDPEINVTSDRSNASKLEINPVYHRLTLDKAAAFKGVKTTKPPAAKRVHRVLALFRHKKRQWERAWPRMHRRLQKQYVDIFSSFFKACMMKELDAEFFRGKRVALVGNASSLKSGSRGPEIDDHDIVIRMNLGYPLTVVPNSDRTDLPGEAVHGRFVDKKSSGHEALTLLRKDSSDLLASRFTNVAATGRKTDIWSCSTSDRERQVMYAPAFDCMTVACHPSFHHLSLRLLLGRRVFRLPTAIFHRLRNELSMEPTSGLIWIEYLRGTDLSSLDIYGFDFFASGHISRTTPNLLQIGGKWPHNPAVERDHVINTVAARDPRVNVVTTKGKTC